MLYRYIKEQKKGKIEPLPYYDITKVQGKEKDLENLLADNLEELFSDHALMPIFQERVWQEEPDLCALDENGTLYIFELKCGRVSNQTTLQVMRYAQIFGQETYAQLNVRYQKWLEKTGRESNNTDLQEAHRDAFQLDQKLSIEQFNHAQKLIVVGNSADDFLVDAIKYWTKMGLDIDFIPYRFFEINNEEYFEFFAKPYDIHCNPSDCKGILFDTNGLNDGMASALDMFAKHKISAFGVAKHFVDWFKKNDYVLYYQKGLGVIGVGRIIDDSSKDVTETERCRSVEILTQKITDGMDIPAISPRELKELLGHGFYYAHTVKRPYLNVDEVELIKNELEKKYKEKEK